MTQDKPPIKITQEELQEWNKMARDFIDKQSKSMGSTFKDTKRQMNIELTKEEWDLLQKMVTKNILEKDFKERYCINEDTE